MADITIRKGHDIQIAGIPKKQIVIGDTPPTVALIPTEFRYVKPKLLVKEGDSVQIGSPLFFDKQNPPIQWASPGAGRVKVVQFGERRTIEKIVIELEKDEAAINTHKYDKEELQSLKREDVADTITRANLWPLIRQRPFTKVVDPTDNPKAIFVSGFNSAPLTPDLETVLENQENAFQAGLDILARLTTGVVHLAVHEQSLSPAFNNVERVTRHRISGPHPAGNVGIHIHHIDPINPQEVIWTITTQHVVVLGRLFLTGQFDPSIVVTIGGTSIKDPIHIKTRLGVSLNTLLNSQLNSGQHRIISGDVLTGRMAGPEEFLGFYDTSVTGIPINHERPFLGWLRPGSNTKNYSLTRSFLAWGKRQFNFTTLRNGARRGLFPINAWEDVLPMDIMPNPLYRSILAQDIEEMEKLGILECDEEDFALCSFACPSKINLGAVIRQGLDLMEKEG